MECVGGIKKQKLYLYTIQKKTFLNGPSPTSILFIFGLSKQQHNLAATKYEKSVQLFAGGISSHDLSDTSFLQELLIAILTG